MTARSFSFCHGILPADVTLYPHSTFPSQQFPELCRFRARLASSPAAGGRYRSLLLLSVTEGHGNEFWRPWELFNYFVMLSFFYFLFRIFFFQIICWQNLLGIQTACLISLVGAKFVLVSDCRAHYQTFDRKSVFQQGLHYKICCQKIPSYWFFSGIKTIRSA